MNLLNFFRRSPAQKARKTKVRKYGPKGISKRGLKKISKAHKKPVTSLSLEGNRLVLKHKPMKTAKYEYRGSVNSKMDFEGSRRRYYRKGWYTEKGISSHKGIFTKIGKKRRFSITYQKNRD